MPTPADKWRTDPIPKKSLPSIAPTNYAPVVRPPTLWNGSKPKKAESPISRGSLAGFQPSTHNSQPNNAMCVPNADTLDAVSYKEMKDCGGTFGSNTVGACSGEALMRAMTNSLDTIFGKLLEAVDALDPNTYVIFISDNGTPMYDRPRLDFIENMYITRTGRERNGL
jgi:hypothetical protein